MTNQRNNLTPPPQLRIHVRKSDVFSERHEAQLVIFLVVMSFLASVATVYGVISAIKWFMT